MKGLELQAPSAPLFMSSMSGRFTCALGSRPVTAIGALASGAWPSANRALYVPLSLDRMYRVRRVWWYNGATVAGNVDVGVYDAESLARLFSTGAIAQSGTDVPQYVSADLTLQPGSYFLALSLSSATATIYNSGYGATAMRGLGIFQQGTAHPLPNPMVPALVIFAYWPFFGLTSTPSGY